MMTLYLLTTKGLGDFYVLGPTPNDAEDILMAKLNQADYGFSSYREVTNIKKLTKEVTMGFNDRLNFSDANKLIVFNQK